MSKSLFIAETKTLSAGYSLVNELERTDSLEIYDLSHNGIGGSFIFGRVNQSETSALENRLKDCFDFVVFEEEKLPVKEALYGLKSQEVKGCLGVLESHSISCNLRVLLQLEDIELLEISSGKGMGGKSIAFFSTEKKEVDLKSNDPNFVAAKIIDEPGTALKRLFQFS